MPSGLKRIYGKGHWHFITFSCYHRLPFLKSVHARNVFVRELAKVRDEFHFALLGYVVMPEHVHLLIGEPPSGTPSIVLRRLKLRAARRLRKRQKRSRAAQMELPFGGDKGAPRSFWQARFYNFKVYTHAKKLEKLHYMHANPLKRKLVEHPKEWRWSSWAAYHRENVRIPVDVQ